MNDVAIRRLTASRVSLARACAWWLRESVTLDTEAPSEPSETGKLVHAIYDAMFRGAPWEPLLADAHPLADTARARKLAVAWPRWWESLKDAPPSHPLHGVEWLRSEVPIAYDLVSGRATALSRDEWEADRDRETGETVAVVDLLGKRADGTIVVVDYKTGSKRETAEESGQLALCGLAAWTAYGYPPGVVVANVYAKIRDPFGVDHTTLDGMRLADVHGEILGILDGAEASEPRAGRHCWTCRARGSCPAMRPDEGPSFFDYGAR